MNKLLCLLTTVALVPTMLAGQNMLPQAKSRNSFQPVNARVAGLKSMSGIKKQLDNTYQEIYNIATGQYDSDYREEYSYNNNGIYQKVICSDYDTLAKAWVFTDEFTNIYDEAGKLVRIDIRSLDLVKNEWGTSKEEYEYNSIGLTAALITSNWDATTSKWIPASKNVMEYSENGNL
ncbi:MAG: hypothetical protein PHY99_04800, partial [Bacteroidales bacterium]|nr:hypothetical protein [Bacteroidales bacterium]